MTRRFAGILIVAVALAACGDDATDANSNNTTANNVAADAGNNATSADMGADGGDLVVYDTPPADCDPLDPTYCSLPWPSSLYLAEDETKPTGLTIAFGETTLPANAQEKHMGTELYRRLDGYGFGTPIMTIFGGVDTSDMAGEATIERSVDPASKSLLLKVTDSGLEQVPHWVELDAHAEDNARRILFMRPAVILDERSRYIVAYRDIETADGPVEASNAFAALRDGAMTDDPAIEARRERFEEVFTALDDFGVERDSLTLAWDFTTGSEENLHAMADRATELALEKVGTEGATFDFREVESFRRNGGGPNPQDDFAAYQISGFMTTPSVLDASNANNALNITDNGLELSDDQEAPIHITVPHRAAEGETVGVIVYGHGMLGSSQEVFAAHLRELAETLGYIIVGVDFRGMSSDDVPGVLASLFDMTKFSHLSDGTVQGIAQTHVLAHAASTSLPAALQAVDPDITLSDDIQWFGASQGGIYGASIMATSPVFRRGILAVPGNNYSTLLHRSVNFEPFFDQLDNAYGDQADLAIVIAAIQLQWDFSDPVTFWRRLAQDDGPQGQRDSLLLISKGDKQVAVVTNEILARTYEEVPLMENYDAERDPWGAPTATYPHQGSGQILFDFGNAWPIDRGNLPPEDPLPDPHSRIAEVDAVTDLVASFLTDSTIIDVCGGDGCQPD